MRRKGSLDVEATGCSCGCTVGAMGMMGGAGIFSGGLVWDGVDSADAIAVGEEVDDSVVVATGALE